MNFTFKSIFFLSQSGCYGTDQRPFSCEENQEAAPEEDHEEEEATCQLS